MLSFLEDGEVGEILSGYEGLATALRTMQATDAGVKSSDGFPDGFRADATSPSLSRAVAIALELAPLYGVNGKVSCVLLFAGVLIAGLKDGIRNAGCSALEQSGADPNAILQLLYCENLLVKCDFSHWLTTCISARETYDSYGWTWCDKSEIPSAPNQTVATTNSVSGGVATSKEAPFSSGVNNTHYVFPRLVCGHSAGLMSDDELRNLVEQGVNTFVCLQTTYNEYGVRDYRVALRRLYPQGAPGGTSIRFLHCPIGDFSVLEDMSLISIVAELQRLLDNPRRKTYVHCMGGHGRTGTVMISLIAAVEGKDARRAREAFCRRHATRQGCNGCCQHKLPEDDSQKNQLLETEPSMKRQHRMNRNRTLAAAVAADGAGKRQDDWGTFAGGKFRVQSTATKEFLYCGRHTLDSNRRLALSWIGGGAVEGQDGEWLFKLCTPGDPSPYRDGNGFRIQNCNNNEFLFVGSKMYDDERRYACTWVGGGDVEGDAGIWNLERVDPTALCFRIRNRKYGEYLYVGGSVLDPQRRLVLTWVGGGQVEGVAGVWQFYEE